MVQRVGWFLVCCSRGQLTATEEICFVGVRKPPPSTYPFCNTHLCLTNDVTSQIWSKFDVAGGWYFVINTLCTIRCQIHRLSSLWAIRWVTLSLFGDNKLRHEKGDYEYNPLLESMSNRFYQGDQVCCGRLHTTLDCFHGGNGIAGHAGEEHKDS